MPHISGDVGIPPIALAFIFTQSKNKKTDHF